MLREKYNKPPESVFRTTCGKKNAQPSRIAGKKENEASERRYYLVTCHGTKTTDKNHFSNPCLATMQRKKNQVITNKA